MTHQQTPEQEAASLISIAAVLVAVVCYLGADRDTPVVTDGVLFFAYLVYGFFPQLESLQGGIQLEILSGALAIGLVVWLIGLAFVTSLANWFSRSSIGELDRQTNRLKRNRARIQKSKRDKDSFDVS